MASIASSGVVLLNDARSPASVTKSVENLASLTPDSPADRPNVAKVEAPSRAACFVSPRDLAALPANFSISFDCFPNRTPAFERVSPRSAAS